MRNIVTKEDILGLQVAGSNPKLQAKSTNCQSSNSLHGQHEYRQHNHKTAEAVLDLFKHTPPADLEINYVEETVFGISDGAPILVKGHPVVDELSQNFKGTLQRVSPCMRGMMHTIDGMANSCCAGPGRRRRCWREGALCDPGQGGDSF